MIYLILISIIQKGMREVIKSLEIPCYALPSDALQDDQKLISHSVNVDNESNKSGRENANVSEKETSTIPQQCNSLFVFPAQCNFSGTKYPLQWISASQSGKLSSHLKSQFCINFPSKDNGGKGDWFCLLDAASYVATNPLGENPDTYYKIIT